MKFAHPVGVSNFLFLKNSEGSIAAQNSSAAQNSV